MSILKPSHLFFISVKIGLLYLLRDSNLDQAIKAIPFFNTKFSDYSRVDEAIYFIGQNQDPYQVEHIFQKPLLVYLFSYLKNIPGAITGLFVLFDLILAELVSNVAFVHSKKKDEHQRLFTSNLIRYIYHLNPFSFFAIITRWTCIFEFTVGLLAVYQFSLNKRFVGSILFGLALYLNPLMLMLIVPIFCSAQLNNKPISGYLGYMIITLLTFVALLFLSFLLTGSFNFLTNAYIHSYSPMLFQPSVGLIWTLFSGMFNRFQGMYHMIFFLLPLCHIFPLIKIFSKAIRENQYTKGLYGFIAGVSLFIGYYHFSYITVYELVLIAFLLFSAYEYLFEIKIIQVLVLAPLIILGLTAMLGKFWFYGLTGNPNFVFFQTFVSYIFFIVLVTEGLKGFTFQKKNELKEQKDLEEKQKKEQAEVKEEGKKEQ